MSPPLSPSLYISLSFSLALACFSSVRLGMHYWHEVHKVNIGNLCSASECCSAAKHTELNVDVLMTFLNLYFFLFSYALLNNVNLVE